MNGNVTSSDNSKSKDGENIARRNLELIVYNVY